MQIKIHYTQHTGRVLEAGEKFEHVMAIALNPKNGYRDGIVRCIVSREGDVAVSGYIDRSELYKINDFVIGEKIVIKNQEEILAGMMREGDDFLGLEDPDIWIDDATGLMHVYFTLPIKHKEKHKYSINLGHAVGRDLDSLEMTEPVLRDVGHGSAKEVSVAPVNSSGIRLNLFESSAKGLHGEKFTYSTVRVAIVEDMGKPWKFGETLFNPEEHNIAWVGGHASPGPLLPKSFLDVGENKLVGILNGREANKMVGGKIKYGMFSVGLFIYDYEIGKIDWVSPESLIQDTEAQTITFASQFVETIEGKGILYAHVDDSFVRAYDLEAEDIKKLLPV